MDNKIVEIEKVNFSYDDFRILEQVDLYIEKRDFLAIIGPNGGGKTTLIKIILGLLRPESGKIKVFNTSPNKAVHRIGYLPQHNFFKSDMPINVLDVVLTGFINKKSWGWKHNKKDKEKAKWALDKVDLLDYQDKDINNLSGGQKQRMFIARALVSDPELLILDEPTSNIDPQGKFCFYQLLSVLSQSTSIILVSHDLSVKAAGINKIACINKKLVYNTQPEITKEMFALLYGIHDHSCPMSKLGPGKESFI